MISHDRAQELISARIDAPLTPAEHRELQNHLAACGACRGFVAQADDLARGLQVLPRLPSSPAVSRAVMAAVSADTSGWSWLRRGLQTLSSPGMAVASGLALVVALAGALIIALNAPGNDNGVATEPEGTIAAVAVAPLPTDVPTEVPAPAPEPTATRAPARTIAPAATRAPAKTPTPLPTATRVPIEQIVVPAVEPTIGPAIIEEPISEPEPVAEEPVLAMAPEEPVESVPSAELAQAAEPEPVNEGVSEAELAPVADEDAQTNNGGRKDRREEAAAEPAPTESLPVPDEAIAALESAGASTDIYLPPAAPLPMPPDQAFLPITPTPVSDGTPTPAPETQTDAPQLAEGWSDDPGVTALAPEAADPTVADVTVVETDETKSKEKRDRSSKDGKSHENQQSAYADDAMGWSMAPIDLAQEVEYLQTADETIEATAATGEATDTEVAVAAEPAPQPETATTPEPAPQYDPATGLEIDPASGLLIDPTTGYLLDLGNGRVIHPGTGYLVHPMTGLLIDPATGAQLDPVTLAIVIPAGFGTDTPEYAPGSDSMRGTIETVVDDTYDNATYKVVPATDGPTQPIGEIVVPTESGDAIEMQ